MECRTLEVATDLLDAMQENPDAVILVLDDVAKSGLTGAGVKMFLEEFCSDINIFVAALYTGLAMQGIARNTITPSESIVGVRAAVKAKV